jgi:hypothetical protein
MLPSQDRRTALPGYWVEQSRPLTQAQGSAPAGGASVSQAAAQQANRPVAAKCPVTTKVTLDPVLL